MAPSSIRVKWPKHQGARDRNEQNVPGLKSRPAFLLPASLQDWLPADHLVHFLVDIVDRWNLPACQSRYEQERRMGPPYHAHLMVKVPS